MLDLQKTISVPPFLSIAVYGDDRRPNGFYVLPTVPRLLPGPSGPQIEMLLYGRGAGDEFTPTGAMLNCSVGLTVSGEERSAAVEAVQATLQGDDEDPPPVQLLGADWLKGRVTLLLTANIRAEGRPSLISDNACVFAMNLSAEQAAELEACWKDPDCDGEIVYELTVKCSGAPAGAPVILRGPLNAGGADRTTWIRRVALE